MNKKDIIMFDAKNMNQIPRKNIQLENQAKSLNKKIAFCLHCNFESKNNCFACELTISFNGSVIQKIPLADDSRLEWADTDQFLKNKLIALDTFVKHESVSAMGTLESLLIQILVPYVKIQLNLEEITPDEDELTISAQITGFNLLINFADTTSPQLLQYLTKK